MNNRGSYWINLLKGADYGAATIFGIPAGIYISSYCEFKRRETGAYCWYEAVDFINWLFSDAAHCRNSLLKNTQDIKEYYGVDYGSANNNG